jgi:hypothetical protein
MNRATFGSLPTNKSQESLSLSVNQGSLRHEWDNISGRIYCGDNGRVVHSWFEVSNSHVK